jgi:hypothetical protein
MAEESAAYYGNGNRNLNDNDGIAATKDIHQIFQSG